MSRNRALEELARMTFPKEEEEARKKPDGSRSRVRLGRQTRAAGTRPSIALANRPRQRTRIGLVASQGNDQAEFSDEDYNVTLLPISERDWLDLESDESDF